MDKDLHRGNIGRESKPSKKYDDDFPLTLEEYTRAIEDKLNLL